MLAGVMLIIVNGYITDPVKLITCEIFDQLFIKNRIQRTWINNIVWPFMEECGEKGNTWLKKQRFRKIVQRKKAAFYVAQFICAEQHECPVRFTLSMMNRPTFDEPAELKFVKGGSHNHEPPCGKSFYIVPTNCFLCIKEVPVIQAPFSTLTQLDANGEILWISGNL
jgi:hypothetical protein